MGDNTVQISSIIPRKGENLDELDERSATKNDSTKQLETDKEYSNTEDP